MMDLLSKIGEAVQWVYEKASRCHEPRRNYTLAEDITIILCINNKRAWCLERKVIWDQLEKKAVLSCTKY